MAIKRKLDDVVAAGEDRLIQPWRRSSYPFLIWFQLVAQFVSGKISLLVSGWNIDLINTIHYNVKFLKTF